MRFLAMETGVASVQVVRSRTLELNLATRELYKNGHKLKLQGQPIEVLAMLLEKPGELVTREQLRKKLWPETTYVDFDHGLNSTINRLREALGDHADEPQFIETLPRLGYRLIVPPGEIPKSATNSLPGESDELSSLQSPQAARAAPETSPVRPFNIRLRTSRSNRWLWTLLSSTGLIAILSPAIWYLRRSLPPPQISDVVQITHDGRNKALIGTDGISLYINQWFPFSIAQVGIASGKMATIPVNLKNPWLTDISEDGSALLVLSELHDSMWSVQLPGSSLRRLLDGKIYWGNWSPDGKSVAYRGQNGDLFVMQSDGTKSHLLIAADADTRGPPTGAATWSPDGKTMRFTKDDKLWEMLSNGTEVHPLLPGWRPSNWQCCGKWTTDGDFYMFLSGNSVSRSSHIWVLDQRRKIFSKRRLKPIQLTSGPIIWGSPVPGKDRKTVFAQGIIQRGELVRYDSQSHQLQPFLAGISAERLRFSPDGKSVAYVTFPEGILWKSDRDGSNAMQLTDPPLYAATPQWSPDGKQILFDGNDAAGQTKNYIISSQGGAPKLFLSEETKGLSEPYWSPDGRKVAFYRAAIGNSESELCILDLDSHRVTALPGSQGLLGPIWSPNGRFIAGIDTSTWGIRLFDFQTQQWKMLVNENAGWGVWSKNGRYIYYLNLMHEPGVYRVRVTEGTSERIVNLEGFRATGSTLSWMSIDPDDTPMLIRDAGSNEVYALTLETKYR
jgi:Tol biopolymer transport system component/DNA-binding winged helix-turn-helix (wHTH) protein